MSGATLCLEFRPYIDLIVRAREFVTDFYEQLRVDSDAVSRVALATHELLENVVKYSSDGRSHFEIELFEKDGDSFVRIRARNRATPDRVADLERLIGEITNGDPMQMYQAFMRRSAGRKDGESGLGLARIRAEGEMTVRCDVAGDEVTIVVEGPVATAGPV